MVKKSESSHTFGMGGFLMKKTGLKMVIGWLCGYLYIQFIMLYFSFTFDKLMIQFILHPAHFFLVMILFFIGVLMNANYIQELLRMLVKPELEKKNRDFSLSLCFVGSILMFLHLLFLKWFPALIFLIFSFIYGIISMNDKEKGGSR